MISGSGLQTILKLHSLSMELSCQLGSCRILHQALGVSPKSVIEVVGPLAGLWQINVLMAKLGFSCCTVLESLVKSRRQDTYALLERSPLVSDSINQCMWFNARKHKSCCEWKDQIAALVSVILNITFQRQPKSRFAVTMPKGQSSGSPAAMSEAPLPQWLIRFIRGWDTCVSGEGSFGL